VRTRGQNKDDNSIKEAIIDLYLKIKIRSKDDEVSHSLELLHEHTIDPCEPPVDHCQVLSA